MTRGPFDVLPTNGYIRPRIRGRQIALHIQSDQLIPQAEWRMGTWRADLRPHGRR